MDIYDFHHILQKVDDLIRDDYVRRDFLLKYFSEQYYSFDAGYRQASYFYNEIIKAKNGDKSIFEMKELSKCAKVYNYFELLHTPTGGSTSVLKFNNDSFDYFGKILELIKHYIHQETDMKDWSKLHEDLINEGYIKDVSQADFNEVMNYKRLPNGKERIIWLTKKSEGAYFSKEFGFEMKNFKKCFIHSDGKDFHDNNVPSTTPDSRLIDLISRHKTDK